MLRAIGRGLVKGVPVVMSALSVIGTAAMIWVGGGILLHGAETLGLAAPAEALHHAAEATGHALSGIAGIASWIVTAIGSGGNFALSAALALVDYEPDAEKLARKAMGIANSICVFTNDQLTMEAIDIA